MLADEAKQIARQFGQAWTAGNLSVVDDLSALDIIVSYAGMPEPIRNAEGFKQLLSDQWYAGLPDAQRMDQEVIAEPDKVAVRWTCRGTHEGVLFGVPATGKSVSLSGISLYRITMGGSLQKTACRICSACSSSSARSRRAQRRRCAALRGEMGDC